MRQLVQSVRSGDLRIVDAPDPVVGAAEVLVATTHSLVSPGTERAVRTLAEASLLQKARARPDLVRQVIRKAKTDGIRSSAEAVRRRLDDEMPLGYAAAGEVLAVGEAVSWARPGMRVATAGAGHGDLLVVSGNLAVPIPDSVESSDAAFATMAAIALHGLRCADLGPGSKVCVIGLGLVGQLTVRLALASGCGVAGVDLLPTRAARAEAAGALGLVEAGESTTRTIVEWSRGRGVDAVIVTAATRSSRPIRRSVAIARDRASLVVIGDVGLDLERGPMYDKELTLKIARSYGPGRYERAYEEWAVDYPAGHVRWTEGRNLEAALDLIASKRLRVDDLVTHRFPFDRAAEAYAVVADNAADCLGIQLEYQAERRRIGARRSVAVSGGSDRTVGLIGAGQFARGVLVPAIATSSLGEVRAVASAGGVSAARLAGDLGATAMTPDEVIDDPQIGVVVIATSHDSHGDLTARALSAGKHVFCEKPLALSEAELDRIIAAWEGSGKHLAVGFNRRHSSWIVRARQVLDHGAGPLVISYRVSAGVLPDGHWYHDRRQGGRLLGEVCHFVDTCHALVDRPAVRIVAVSGGRAEAGLDEDLVVGIAYEDGSVAAITYATGGHASTAKEQIVVHGRGHSVTIDDFRAGAIDGARMRGEADKGHVQQLRAFSASLLSDDPGGARAAIATTRDLLVAAAQLTGFRPAAGGDAPDARHGSSSWVAE